MRVKDMNDILLNYCLKRDIPVVDVFHPSLNAVHKMEDAVHYSNHVYGVGHLETTIFPLWP